MSTRERVNSQLCVTLPTFVVMALRLLVDEVNEERPQESPWTVSRLLETFLIQAIRRAGRSTFERFATKSPAFKRAAEAWVRSERQRNSGRPQRPDARDGQAMSVRFVLRETSDGRICGHVPGVLNTTVYARSEQACIARLRVVLRRSLKRAGDESRNAFAGLQRHARR